MYKRLTNKEYLTKPKCFNCEHNYSNCITCERRCVDGDCFELRSELKRLIELEDKIENGTLIELPCKVNDTVYVLREDSFAEDNYKKMWHIAEGFVKKIYINTKNEIFLQIISWVDHKSWSKDSRNYKISTFGKSLFLTKAEAEQKLLELRGEV